MNHYWILTCEHASNVIPARFVELFAKKGALLETHRGYDIGARHYAMAIARALECPLVCGHFTRLLVDLNRSSDSSQVFSPITKDLDQSTRREILSRYYTPFRTKVRQLVEQKVSSGVCVIHISCHTFTPILGKSERKMDLGVLYDPHRVFEKSIAKTIRQKLKAETSMCVRCNAPYRGASDGHVTGLRKLFSPDQYVGIELEVNQALYVPIKSQLWQDAWLPILVEILRVLSVSKE
jgi:predicted N-formylglutamate amidohydrolase